MKKLCVEIMNNTQMCLLSYGLEVKVEFLWTQPLYTIWFELFSATKSLSANDFTLICKKQLD
jgi:hypothetical protein